MRLSIYGLDGFTLGIIQFIGEEKGAIIDRLKSVGVGDLKMLISKTLGSEVKGLGLAFGKLQYNDQILDMAYLHISSADGDEYILEIYRESGMLITNISVPETYEKVVKLLKEICPRIKTPRSRLIGI
ncbi:hypothetical protein Smar_1538 [Staphylothermus marinus F1]|uniref:Uncharacterized protein n=1 Tax=Staphylothermus marinus (strain ATCC 43588 / DSM 3639 / JCM 9404 / F1) TaxID=399550 RepID=A3DPR4_STAMF|nr:hypothetical protein [Staphylothermus marinus]ABN70624.1 hypothetical protein Smar_1538 [Staphylothermus marinus F1]